MAVVPAETMRAVPWKTIGLILLVASSLALVGALVWGAATAAGVPDPTDDAVRQNMSTGSVIVGAGILVFREGLETILVLSAITASMVGANATQRKPIAAGGGIALIASIVTWFVVVAILDAVNAPELQIQVVTGWIAIAVLLVVMNWFFHRVYWTGWIQRKNRAKRRLLALPGDAHRQILFGLGLLGFTSVYREGFEVVLFLQTLRLNSSALTVLAGVAVGLYLTVTVGVLTFIAHHRLPYKKMLVFTGAMLSGVLLLMVGEEIAEMQLANWMTSTPLPGGIQFPDWMGTWFSLTADWETLTAMFLAAVFVVGSYVVANYVRVRRPQRRGEEPAVRPEQAPGLQATSSN
jgi:high-affinity iron transporter